MYMPQAVRAQQTAAASGCMHPHLLNMSSMRCVTTKPPNTLMNETKAAVAPSICKQNSPQEHHHSFKLQTQIPDMK
jgi:hypothetical protein